MWSRRNAYSFEAHEFFSIFYLSLLLNFSFLWSMFIIVCLGLFLSLFYWDIMIFRVLSFKIWKESNAWNDVLMIYVWICLIKCPKNSFKFHQELAPLCRQKLLKYIFQHYSPVYILMGFLVLNQQYKRTSMQTRNRVNKKRALGLAYWRMSIITTTKRQDSFALQRATTPTYNKLLFIMSITNVNI